MNESLKSAHNGKHVKSVFCTLGFFLLMFMVSIFANTSLLFHNIFFFMSVKSNNLLVNWCLYFCYGVKHRHFLCSFSLNSTWVVFCAVSLWLYCNSLPNIMKTIEPKSWNDHFRKNSNCCWIIFIGVIMIVDGSSTTDAHRSLEDIDMISERRNLLANRSVMVWTNALIKKRIIAHKKHHQYTLKG